MKPDPIQQEILLMSNTTFSDRELSYTSFLKKTPGRLMGRRLKHAIENDFLDTRLPEISEKCISGKKLDLWNIKYGRTFFEIELGSHPELVERSLSIDPYEFLPVLCNN